MFPYKKKHYNCLKWGWRKLHNEELNYLCTSPNIRMIKPRRMGGACGTHESDEKFIQNSSPKT
jgi:hypothetical protein